MNLSHYKITTDICNLVKLRICRFAGFRPLLQFILDGSLTHKAPITTIVDDISHPAGVI